MINNPARQTLRRLPQQIRRGGTQNQKPPGTPLGIDQRADDGEKTGLALNLIEDHQRAGMLLEIKLGLGELGRVRRPFQVEINRARKTRGDAMRQCGLADLARPDEPHHRKFGQGIQYRGLKATFYHPCNMKDYLSFCKDGVGMRANPIYNYSVLIASRHSSMITPTHGNTPTSSKALKPN